MKNLSKIFLSFIAIVFISGCVIGNQFSRNGENVNVTFGNVHVATGDDAGHLETVNGNIFISSDTSAKSAEVVNGNIDVGRNSQVGDLSIVNGNIEIGKHAIVNGSVETVNGSILAKADSIVHNDLTITNGRIEISENVQVMGDIKFDESTLKSMFESSDNSSLIIAEGAVLHGNIILYNVVDLELPPNFDRSKIERRYKQK